MGKGIVLVRIQSISCTVRRKKHTIHFEWRIFIVFHFIKLHKCYMLYVLISPGELKYIYLFFSNFDVISCKISRSFVFPI